MKTSSPLRIGVVTSTYARSTDDPQVPWMREQIRRLKDSGLDIEVFAPAYKGLGSHHIDGVKVNRFRYGLSQHENLTHDEGAPNKKKTLFFKAMVLSYLFFGTLNILWWCKKKNIQVLHVHWPFPHGIWSLLPKYLLGVKILAMSHGAELCLARNSKPIRTVLGWLLKRADICCANSSHTASEVKKFSGRDSVITPYGATVQAKQSRPSADAEVPTLLFCGRLIQRKGIDVLLRALPSVLEQKQVKVVITGEGDRKAEWQALTTKLGLDNTVRFAGFVSDEELAELYETSDLYVHPAIFDDKGDTEGLGVVLIEALAHRKAVVASGVGGIIDVIIDGETGLLVPEKDEAALASAIIRVLEDPALAQRLGEGGFNHVQKFFDWNRITKQVSEIYLDLLGKAAPASEAPQETVANSLPEAI
ncbi:MAG: glycosyltransferase family 4 protein [Verrucomicrobiota bacterium]